MRKNKSFKMQRYRTLKQKDPVKQETVKLKYDRTTCIM